MEGIQLLPTNKKYNCNFLCIRFPDLEYDIHIIKKGQEGYSLNQPIIDFNKISQALTDTIEAIKDEKDLSFTALEQLKNAQHDLQQAISFSFTSVHK